MFLNRMATRFLAFQSMNCPDGGKISIYTIKYIISSRGEVCLAAWIGFEMNSFFSFDNPRPFLHQYTVAAVRVILS